MRILYFDIDSLTPSHLSCYGYERATSPNIDALAQEGTRCTNVYCSDAPCLPSRTALYSGRFGIQTGVVGHGGTAAEPRREGPTRGFRDNFAFLGLAAQLRGTGLHAAMVSPFGERHAAHWFYAGFNEVHNTGKGGMELADDITPVVEQWLQTNAAGDNWYLHVNYWDPHTPYRTPAGFGEPFAEAPLPPWMTDDMLARHQKRGGPHSALDLGMWGDSDPVEYPRAPARLDSRAALKKWIDGYDVGVLYADAHIGRIVALLKKMGLYDDIMIVVGADHGENQGELGIYGEHATADKGTCNVPLVVKGEGIAAGGVDERLHYQLDWAPTLLELAGQDTAPALWDGLSFAGSLGQGTPSGRSELIVSQCAHVCQRSVRWDNWLYMKTYHDGMHPFPAEMLYDLKADPHEQNDVATANTAAVREGAWRLARWHDEQMQNLARRGSDVADPLWTVISEGGPAHAHLDPGNAAANAWLPAYLQRLRATGRTAAADALAVEYAVEV